MPNPPQPPRLPGQRTGPTPQRPRLRRRRPAPNLPSSPTRPGPPSRQTDRYPVPQSPAPPRRHHPVTGRHRRPTPHPSPRPPKRPRTRRDPIPALCTCWTWLSATGRIVGCVPGLMWQSATTPTRLSKPTLPSPPPTSSAPTGTTVSTASTSRSPTWTTRFRFLAKLPNQHRETTEFGPTCTTGTPANRPPNCWITPTSCALTPSPERASTTRRNSPWTPSPAQPWKPRASRCSSATIRKTLRQPPTTAARTSTSTASADRSEPWSTRTIPNPTWTSRSSSTPPTSRPSPNAPVSTSG